MDDSSGLHSRWRIAIARRLATACAGMRGVRMIVPGGSPSRGLAVLPTESSDLDAE
jgi:hypothetical protein